MGPAGEDGGEQNGEKDGGETGKPDPHALHASLLPRTVHCAPNYLNRRRLSNHGHA
jgi:hypothetical protein